MPTFSVRIVNRLGLHARAASRLVGLAKGYAADVELRRADRIVNGKSIMSVMLLEAAAGSDIQVTVTGDDADAAAEALKALIERGFDEDTDYA
ncbi:MAG: HPr family phosphocarrier protein [Pseudomonadota bacterium]